MAGHVSVTANTMRLTPPRLDRKSSHSRQPKVTVDRAPQGFEGAVRLDANTCDLRGMRVDEALDSVERFVDRMVSAGDRYGYLLHGHGTGALKQAVREWARSATFVLKSRPAREDEGGDAFTILEIG